MSRHYVLITPWLVQKYVVIFCDFDIASTSNNLANEHNFNATEFSKAWWKQKGHELEELFAIKGENLPETDLCCLA